MPGIDPATIVSSGATLASLGEKTQSVDSLTWHLDRIDQRAFPLDKKFTCVCHFFFFQRRCFELGFCEWRKFRRNPCMHGFLLCQLF
jgi:hypothetical protein